MVVWARWREDLQKCGSPFSLAMIGHKALNGLDFVSIRATLQLEAVLPLKDPRVPPIGPTADRVPGRIWDPKIPKGTHCVLARYA